MPNKEQKGFIVYGDVKDVVDELDNEQAGELFRGMIDYFVDGTEPNFSDVLKFVFIPIKQQMDRDAGKYIQRCNKNRENVKKRYERIRSNTNVYDGIRPYTKATNTDTNTNTDTDTKKDTDTNTKSRESDTNDVPLSLISYLNEKTGSSYKVDADITSRIISLFGQGYSVDDMRTVIDRKCAEWCDDKKMRSYLRPSTLFGDKFAEYLNAPESIEAEQKKGAAAKQEQLLKSLSDKESELEQLSERIEQIRNGGDDSISEHFDELNELKLKQAIAEQDIESLKRRTGAVGT